MGPHIGQGFRDVDRAGRPDAFVAYLDDARAALADVKRASFAALELHAGDAVLDVGCGTGDDLRALAALVEPGRAVGIDTSESLLAEARARTRELPGVETLRADAHALPFPDSSFAATRAERLLMHVEDPAAVVAGMARVTRPGGRVVTLEPDWDTLVVDSDDLATARRVVRAQADTIHAPDIGRRLPRLAMDAGLEVLAVHAHALPIADLAAADTVLQLGAAVRALGDGDAHRWWERVRRTAAGGRFLAAMTGFLVVAVRPVS